MLTREQNPNYFNVRFSFRLLLLPSLLLLTALSLSSSMYQRDNVLVALLLLLPTTRKKRRTGLRLRSWGGYQIYCWLCGKIPCTSIYALCILQLCRSCISAMLLLIVWLTYNSSFVDFARNSPVSLPLVDVHTQYLFVYFKRPKKSPRP